MLRHSLILAIVVVFSVNCTPNSQTGLGLNAAESLDETIVIMDESLPIDSGYDSDDFNSDFAPVASENNADIGDASLDTMGTETGNPAGDNDTRVWIDIQHPGVCDFGTLEEALEDDLDEDSYAVYVTDNGEECIHPVVTRVDKGDEDEGEDLFKPTAFKDEQGRWKDLLNKDPFAKDPVKPVLQHKKEIDFDRIISIRR